MKFRSAAGAIYNSECAYCYCGKPLLCCMYCDFAVCHEHAHRHAVFHNMFVQLSREEGEFQFFACENGELKQVYSEDDDAISLACELLECYDNQRFYVLAQAKPTQNEYRPFLYPQCRHIDAVKEAISAGSLKAQPLEEIKCGCCEKTQNLWMCLSCGKAHCGRYQYNGTGGNGHALAHYEATKHPLSVKITSLCAGCQECYCYACDGNADIPIPELRDLLHRFGVADLLDYMNALECSLELYMSMTDRLLYVKQQASEATHDRLSAEQIEKTALIPFLNVGNTCYANTIVEAMLGVGAFYALRNLPVPKPDGSFYDILMNVNANVYKIIDAAEGRIARTGDNVHPNLAPLLLSLRSYLTDNDNIGRQQDCAEFLELLLDRIPPLRQMFQIEGFRKIIKCSACGAARFASTAPTTYITISCNFFDQATDVEQGMPIDLQEALAREYFGFYKPTFQYRCYECGNMNLEGCEPIVRIGSSLVDSQAIPTFLVVRANRIYYDQRTYQYAKLRTRIQNCLVFDLASLVDKEHYECPSQPPACEDNIDVTQLIEVGIDEYTARYAFLTYNGDLDAIVNDFFNGCLRSPYYAETEDQRTLWELGEQAANSSNDNMKYELRAFVAHLGATYDVGHYVCYVKEQTRWVCCNDAVLTYQGESSVPIEQGVLYFYRHIGYTGGDE